MSSTPDREAITFRSCTAEDDAFLRYLYASTRQEELALTPWSTEEKTAFVNMQFDAQKMHYDEQYEHADFLVVELEGRPIGRLYVTRNEDEIEIIDITLLPQERRHGIGRMLFEEFIEEARAAGKKVVIYVENFNPARHLYDRLGFRPVDTYGVYDKLEWTSNFK